MYSAVAIATGTPISSAIIAVTSVPNSSGSVPYRSCDGTHSEPKT